VVRIYPLLAIQVGNLESDTVKCGHESLGTRTWEWLRWRGSTAIVNDRPILSSEGMLHKTITTSLSWKINLLVLGLKGLVAKTKYLAVSRQSGSNSDSDSEASRRPEREWSESSAVKEEGFGWRLIVSSCNWLWLRETVQEGDNKSNHPIKNPLLLVTESLKHVTVWSWAIIRLEPGLTFLAEKLVQRYCSACYILIDDFPEHEGDAVLRKNRWTSM
jgi:hypothetical protein